MTTDAATWVKPIARSRILLRGRYGWPHGEVPFSRDQLHSSGYRANALGFMSMCWGIPLNAPHSLGGMNSISMETEGWAQQIQPLEMLPGDAMGLLGPSSASSIDGVLVLFEGWLENDYRSGYAMVIEHLPETAPGPNRRARPFDSINWRCYRRVGVVDDL